MEAIHVAIIGGCQLPDAVVRIGQIEVDDYARPVLAAVSKFFSTMRLLRSSTKIHWWFRI